LRRRFGRGVSACAPESRMRMARLTHGLDRPRHGENGEAKSEALLQKYGMNKSYTMHRGLMQAAAVLPFPWAPTSPAEPACVMGRLCASIRLQAPICPPTRVGRRETLQSHRAMVPFLHCVHGRPAPACRQGQAGGGVAMIPFRPSLGASVYPGKQPAQQAPGLVLCYIIEPHHHSFIAEAAPGPGFEFGGCWC
jgi:hypothetical protein